MLMYSVYDKAVEAYLSPFSARSHGEAKRAFMGLCRQPGSAQHDYPHDFALWHVGVFEEHTGLLRAPSKGAQQIMSGVEAVRTMEDDNG